MGGLTAEQLEGLADIAAETPREVAHVTTRQNIQYHFVKLDRVTEHLRRLAETGLTTREACGNTVRNVTAGYCAGVCAKEAFDVTPYAEAVARYLLRNPMNQHLPRKFKISFSGCPVGGSTRALRLTPGPASARRDFKQSHDSKGGGTCQESALKPLP